MSLKNITYSLLIGYFLFSAYAVISLAGGVFPPGWITPLSTLTGFSFAVLHAGQLLGWRRAFLLLGLTFVISLAMESLGVATGWVYGPYHYTDKLGPKFLGLVPYLIPIAWFMMTYPSWVITQRILPGLKQTWQSIFTHAAVGGLVMTAWDVGMDPMMTAGEHWVWEVEGAFFGIPLQNYWGWWLTIFLTFGAYSLIQNRLSPQIKPQETSFQTLAVASYTLTGLSTVLTCLTGSLTASLAGAGLAGLFAMAPWVVMGWVGTRGDRKPGAA